MLDSGHEVTRGVEIALVDEERVGVHRVDLQRDILRPGATELAGRDARADQQGADSARPGLRELLRGEHAQGEPGVHEFLGQSVDGAHTAFGNGVEPDLLRVADAGVEVSERPPVVQIGNVDGVAGPLEFVGERDDAGGAPVCVVEHHDVSNATLPTSPVLPGPAMIARIPPKPLHPQAWRLYRLHRRRHDVAGPRGLGARVHRRRGRFPL